MTSRRVRDLAKLNSSAAMCAPPSAASVTNMELRPGTYLAPGKGVMALLDSDSLHVEGYFEETQAAAHSCRRSRERAADGGDHVLRGRVESVAAGIGRSRSQFRRKPRHRAAARSATRSKHVHASEKREGECCAGNLRS